MEQQKSSKTYVVGYTRNLFVWVALMILTGGTIYVAGINLGTFGILTNILIASVKASFVVYIFMHLKYETWLIKLLLFLVVLTLTLIITLTFLDILYR
jgi:cytochrome c oxidase subunit 4